MKDYLRQGDFDQSRHYATPKTMFVESRIMNDKEGGIWAIMLYTAIADKISLSEKRANKGDTNFMNLKGEYFCCFPEKDALQEIGIKSSSYKQAKKFLKRIGLIDYGEQKSKKQGEASRITYTPWEKWVEANGLYSNGEWIIEPLSVEYYLPQNIVEPKPRYKKELIF
jgi:hypothetical protein